MTPDNADTDKPARKHDVPAPGPHAKPELIDKEKTPGSGILPDAENANQAPSG
jgi:hypothetical protein